MGYLANMSRWKHILRSTLTILLVFAGFEVLEGLRRPPFVSAASRSPEAVVQLRRATLPWPLSLVAYHQWFVAFHPVKKRWHRWEVWQVPSRCKTSWRHVHLDLMSPDGDVGGGPFEVAQEWRGTEARALIGALSRASTYPHRDRYIAWPGPNCNTFVAWVLREARVACDLHPMAIGKDYFGMAGAARSTTRTGVQIETPVLGIMAGLSEGIELHLFCLTFGLDLWPPAIKTPFGRLGFGR